MEHLIGKKVLTDIVNAYGTTVVPANTILTYEALRLIVNHKIDLRALSFTPSPAAVEANQPDKKAVNKLVRRTVAKSKELFESIYTSKKVPVMEIRAEVLPAVQDLSANPSVFELFESVKAKDDYTYQHNIGVGVISTMIGRWLNMDDKQLSTLSLAATLHDVGKVNIPIEILNKPGKLTEEEYELVKKHTIFGYELLKQTPGISPKVARVALQHHEREDGGGYPLGLKRDKIDYLSAVVAVADVFHAMTSKRPYHEPEPFHEIISQMARGKFGELNPHIVSLFLENVMKKMIGKQVILTDGRTGEVVMLNPHRMETPLVRIADEFVDLSREEGLRIREVIS
ncbi:HD-GYP domain-containing protein [Paenibacillus sp. NPDC058071]|uniref:HD-GYP domain-containing protein n=1 Tax=Paenibacillus sp. NPDC058071 TaxID=3346326 RepID=UPI0036D86C76